MDAKQVPLRELLASVPADARLVIDDADGKGTRFIPVGRLCQDAAAALAEPCPCGDRAAAKCPGEWEPGCDLGNNPKYAKRVEMTPKELAASIKRGEKWKVAEPGSLMIAAQQFLEWNRAQSPPPVTVGFELGVFEAVKTVYPFPPQRKPEPNSDYERGFVDGMSEQARRSVDKAVNAMIKCKPLAEEEIARLVTNDMVKFARAIERAHGIGEQQ